MKKVFIWWMVFVVSWFSFWSVFAITLWSNYTFNESTVDNWEIRWWGSTKYSTAWNHAKSKWNDMWKVDILPDSITTIEDLTLIDIYSTTDNFFWMMNVDSWWSDELYLNKYYLDGDSDLGSFSSNNIKHTVIHELWHALGLAHSYGTNVMRQWKLTITSLGTQDKSSYATKWWN